MQAAQGLTRLARVQASDLALDAYYIPHKQELHRLVEQLCQEAGLLV